MQAGFPDNGLTAATRTLPNSSLLRVVRMRGVELQGGSHHILLDTGIVALFPRLIAASHRSPFDAPLATTGSRRWDAMPGGGLAASTDVLFLGPSGAGKSSTAAAISEPLAPVARSASMHVLPSF